MNNEVTDLLNALHEGKLTVNDVAKRFRERNWPQRQQPEPGSYAEMVVAEAADPDPYIPGSYDDVAAAYHRGQLTDSQYSVLIEAIAESKRASDASDGEADAEQ